MLWRDGDGRGRGERGEPEEQIVREREPRESPTDGLLEQQAEADGGVGQRVEVGDVSLRLFEVRSEDVVYFAPAPGARVGVEDSLSGEFVAVDFVAQNDGTEQLTVRPETLLEDDGGATHRRVESVQVPNLIGGEMALEPGQKKASTLFFGVPNGTTPERLGVRVAGEAAGFDLLADERDRVPADDYLRVYHLYFAQRAYEEAYEMYDPATTQGITQGDWIRFYEPLWGSRFIGLDSLTRVFVVGDEAEFEMDRTFYERDGDPVDDAVLNAPVLQEMVRSGGPGAWSWARIWWRTSPPRFPSSPRPSPTNRTPPRRPRPRRPPRRRPCPRRRRPRRPRRRAPCRKRPGWRRRRRRRRPATIAARTSTLRRRRSFIWSRGTLTFWTRMGTGWRARSSRRAGLGCSALR